MNEEVQMRITVKGATPEQVETFAQDLSNALNRPIFRWNQDQEGARGTVLEFDAILTDDIENAQKTVEKVADFLGVDVMFWTYKTTRRLVTI